VNKTTEQLEERTVPIPEKCTLEQTFFLNDREAVKVRPIWVRLTDLRYADLSSL
jgi:hypothetical protein